MNNWLVPVVLALLLVAGCAQKSQTGTGAQEGQTAQASTDAAVSSLEQDIEHIDSLDNELDTSDLDALDQDLEALQ